MKMSGQNESGTQVTIVITIPGMTTPEAVEHVSNCVRETIVRKYEGARVTHIRGMAYTIKSDPS